MIPFHVESRPSEVVDVIDPISGMTLQRLTSAPAHSHHLYFTKPSITPDGSFLIHASERSGSNELWACALDDGRLYRLTDGGVGASPNHELGYSALSRDGQRIALWQRRTLVVIDVTSGTRHELYTVAENQEYHGLSWTSDDTEILTCQSDQSQTGVGTSTAQRLAWMSRSITSRILAIHARTGQARILHTDSTLITHVEASPTRPDLLTFCHEGPWLTVQQRIWGLRRSGGAPWRIAPKIPEWGIGHEYWLASGESVGFHARHAEGTWRHAAGFAHAENGSMWQAEIPVPTHHAVGLDDQRMLLDGTRATGEYLMIIQRQGDSWATPRILCRHGSSRHHHRAHVHARVTAGGKSAIFTSDMSGYCQVYKVEIPDALTDLPLWEKAPTRYYWE